MKMIQKANPVQNTGVMLEYPTKYRYFIKISCTSGKSLSRKLRLDVTMPLRFGGAAARRRAIHLFVKYDRMRPAMEMNGDMGRTGM